MKSPDIISKPSVEVSKKSLYKSPHRELEYEIREEETHALIEELEMANLALIGENKRRKQAEEQIHKLSQAVEQSSCAIVITDTTGIIEYVNSKFCRISGFSFEEAVGKTPCILKSGKQSSEQYRQMWETITSGREWRGEFCNRKKDGTLYWEYSSISPVKNEEDVITHFIAVKEDITRRRQLEEELRISHKMFSIGRLTASVFHEILNPVNIISTHTQLLLMEAEKGSKTEEDLKSILEEIERIVTITDKLVQFTKGETDEVGPIEINDLLRSTLSFFKTELNEKCIQPVLQFENELREVTAHENNLYKAFLNIISNAIEAMPEGGTLTVKTRCVRSKKLGVESKKESASGLRSPDSELNGDSVRITFADTGCGVAKDHIDKVFEPFFSTKQEIKGVGLGLSSSYTIIEGCGGKIKLESEEGKGTTVTMDLPVKDF